MSGHHKWSEIKHKNASPTQVTPKGLEIPVPKRSEVMDALDKIAKPPAKPKP